MKSILIIEDEPDILEVIAEILDLHGYETETASNGKKGLDLAKAKQYDLIISDIAMPKMSGFEMLKALRADAIMTPCIFLSAHAQKEDILIGKASNAEHYLTKPFTMVELLKAVTKVFNK